MTKHLVQHNAVVASSLIRTIRGQKVILDSDLARLYGVPTRRLNEQVRRNSQRFPQDFIFRLSEEETEALSRSRSQFATLRELPVARQADEGEPVAICDRFIQSS